MNTQPPLSAPQPARRGRPWLVAAALGVTFSALFVVGLVPRMHRNAELAAAANAARTEVPTVMVAPVVAAANTSPLDLPGEIKAFQEAAVFARSSGYLKSRLVDIGDRVHTGQLLAEIQSPDLDKELAQAQAALGGAEANLTQAKTELALARTTAQRWQALRKDGSVAQQDADEKQAAFETAGAKVQAMAAAADGARHNVQRLVTLTRFERVVAPFDGTITLRGADPGALIGQAGGTTSGPIFKIAEINRLRIDVQVPEPFAPAVSRGMPVTVVIRELGKPYPGKVVRTSGALDPASRTLLTEVELTNDGKLMPGMYAQVQFAGKRTTEALQVPGNAIVTRAKGNEVAVVDPDGVVHYRTIQTGVDDGQNVEVASGLKAGDQVVIGPSDDVRDGGKVKTVPFKDQ